MAKKPSSVGKSAATESEILSYRHADRRKNNPEVGMVTPATDADDSKTTWQHDPHLDPSLSWTGKAERLSFEVDTVSLHVHERIDPASILSAVRKKVGAGDTAKDKAKGAKAAQMKAIQPGLFDAPFESLPLRDVRIAMWSQDRNREVCSLFSHQVFFPLIEKGDGWDKLKKDIHAELDEGLPPQFHSTVSLPFAARDNRKVAVKIVDDRGIESLKIVNLED